MLRKSQENLTVTQPINAPRMRKVFWENPYQHTLDTKVAAIDGKFVVFEATIAFSFSGGQESDRATVNDMPILNSKMLDGDTNIYYELAEDHGLSVGDAVVMKIDWERRYRLMRLHFSAELVLELVTKQLQYEKCGAHIGEHGARIDFMTAVKFTEAQLSKILAEFKAIIDKDCPIIKAYDDEETQRRYWKIDDFAKVPCGGTHVESTAEVGYVTLNSKNVGTSKKPQQRILITLEDDGTKDYEKMRASGFSFFTDAASSSAPAPESQIAKGFRTVTKK